MTRADSIIAVLVFGSHQNGARHGLWAASTVLIFSVLPPSNLRMTSPKPSPPSLIGSNVSLSERRARCHPRLRAWAAASAVSVPLNLSGIMRTLSAMHEEVRLGGPKV